MNFASYWLKHRTVWQAFPLIGFAFFASFTISISQLMLGISIAVWLFDFLAQRIFLKEAFAKQAQSIGAHSSSQKIVEFQGGLGPADEVLYKMPWIFLFTILIIYAIYWYIHIPLSSMPLKEFEKTKELLLLFIIPLIAFRLPRKKHEDAFYISLLLGALLTSLFNIYEYLRLDFSGGFRAGAFNTMLTLTYAGIMAMIVLLGLGKTLENWRSGNKKLFVIFAVMTFFNLIGFYLARSGGVTLAFAGALVLFFLFVLRRKSWYFLPLLIIIPILIVASSQRVRSLSISILEGNPENTIYQRTLLWRTGWRVFLDYPILGTGSADRNKHYLERRIPEIDPVLHPVAYKGSHMHNDFLDKLVMFGILGLIIFILMIFTPVAQWLRWYWQHGRFREAAWSYWKLYAIGAALFMFPLMSMTQCHYSDDEVQVVYWAIVALFYREIYWHKNTAKEKD